MIKEFKEFINKGNVFDAAVGLILALAFAPVVQGLVDNVIMPVVARIFGKPDFSDIRINLGGSFDATDPDTGEVLKTSAGEVIQNPAYMEIGTWITTVLSFVILAFVVFMMVKMYNKSTKKQEEEAGPTDNELLLEIRDSLKKA